MLVQVTAEHIKKGALARTDLCPVALALQDMGYVTFVTSTTCRISKDMWEHETCYTLPEKVYHFIHEFDSGNQVTPINFILEK